MFSKLRLSAGRRFMSTATTVVAEGPTSSYKGAVQAMHWSMGTCILGCFGFVQLAQNTKDKKLKMDYMFYHKSFGTLAAALLMPRLIFKAVSKGPGPMSSVLWEKIAAQVSHAAMYGFMIVMPVTGVAMGYYGGKGLPIFFTSIPGAEKPDGKQAGWFYKWHKKLGWYMEMLFLGHLGGVGYHMIRGENILARILPLAAKK